MTAYSYTAMTQQGQQRKGVLEADSERLLRQQLRDMDLVPISIKPVSASSKSTKDKLSSQGRSALSRTDLSLFTRQLATLIGAGMPLDESLLACAEQAEKDKVKAVIMGVRAGLLEGHSLGTAMASFPKVFSSLYRATISAGEHSGHLDTILERLADYIEKQQAIRQKIQQALIYPSIMTIVSIAIVIFLLVFVVPKMIDVFSNTQQQLPMMTTILIAISDGIAKYGLAVLLLLIVLFIGFRILINKNISIKRRYHQLLLKLPLLGKNIKIINTARFARTMGILSNAGVPIIEAMQAATGLITNLPIQEAVSRATNKVREGTHINRALKQCGYFPAMSIHLIASGEASGKLEAMLERAADNQDNQVERMIDTTLSLFEPLLILIMGAVVLFIVLAILLPIFALNQFVS